MHSLPDPTWTERLSTSLGGQIVITIVICFQIFLPWFFVCLGVYGLFWWTDDGRRVIWRLLRSQNGYPDWTRLETPYRKWSKAIFYRRDDAKSNERIESLFHRVKDDEIVKTTIKSVLAKHREEVNPLYHADFDAVVDQRLEEWQVAVVKAQCVLIYPRRPWFRAGGWAMSKGADSSECVLGLEHLYSKLGRLTASAAGHELTHVAQDLRPLPEAGFPAARIFREEWRGMKRWKKWNIEGEALTAFGGVFVAWMILTGLVCFGITTCAWLMA